MQRCRRPNASQPTWQGRGWVLALALALWAGSAGAAAVEARSADLQWRLVGNGAQLELHDNAGRVARRYLARARAADADAPAVASIHHAAARRSFVVSFSGLAEVWEILLDPHAEPLYQGLVHDFRMGEGVAEPGFLAVRRTRLPVPLPASTLDHSGSYLLGRAADLPSGKAVLHLVHLDVRRSIARFELDADPDLAAARPDEPDTISVPDRRGAAALVVDVVAMRLLSTAVPKGLQE